MLVIDELKKNDPQLRLVALTLLAGLFVLFAGLWWVQIVSAHEYRQHLETQAYRTIRLPAIRGKILDRAGRVLAENRPCYNLCLYFDDLSDQFKAEYKRLRPMIRITNSAPFWRFWNRAPTVSSRRSRLSAKAISALEWQARYNVVNRIATQVGRLLGVPLTVDPKQFMRSYTLERSMPFIILSDLTGGQIARFQENHQSSLGTELQLQAVRTYPYGATAAHLLGYLRRDNSSDDDESYNYRLPDYIGVMGIEASYDNSLHGQAGEESVLVNNLGYRQSTDIDVQPEAGENVVLTIDLDLQRAAEKAVAESDARRGDSGQRGVVVMNVNTGDILAMVSTPDFDPNDFAQGISHEKYAQLQQVKAEVNHATQENYAPGSVFKPIVALACLENGMNPRAFYTVQPNPVDPRHGCIYVGRRKIRDTVPPGEYDLQRAIEQSSNAYFIYHGLQTGIEKVIRMAEKFHFGERTDFATHQETQGILPTLAEVRSPDWHDGDSANICFGQGKLAVTPLQMAVAYSAIANGGTVLWPQLVERIEPQDAGDGKTVTYFPSGVVRDHIGVSARNLRILRAAMLTETEDAAGTGRAAVVGPEMRICGKTGTAQVENIHGRVVKHNYWFASFAPYENPKYAVIVMVQSTLGGSGGGVCAPIAHDIYEAILKKENSPAAKTVAVNTKMNLQN